MPPEVIKALAMAPWALPAGVGVWFLGQIAVARYTARQSESAQENAPSLLAVLTRLTEVLERMERDQREVNRDMFALVREARDMLRDQERLLTEQQALIDKLPDEVAAQVRLALKAG